MSALYGTPPHSATSNGFNHSSSPSPFKVDDDDDPANFESPNSEANYYRDKYRVAVELLNETRAELDEFQISSRELEQELEKELEATEAKHADLQERILRLEADKDEWKNKFIALQKQHSSTVGAMQLEMDNLRSERDKTLVAIRELEMGNDELESKHRVTHSSLLDMEIKYNRTIEEKTLLEQEVITKQELDEECQRLKDDVRDANNEIAILRDRLARAVVPTPPSSDAPMSPMLDLLSRTEAASPTPTDSSVGTHRSSQSATMTSRSDRSPTVTPRTVRQSQSPRIPRSTTTPVLGSPSVRRTISAPSPSGIPALTRSTTTRNVSSLTEPLAPMRRTFTTANVSGQTTKTKGLRLLQDIQTRLKATDDRLGARMPKRSVLPPRKSVLQSSTTGSTNAQHTRVSALSKPPPGANITPTGSSSTYQSPPGEWVMLSDPEDTPPARPGMKKYDHSSPLEPIRGVGARKLPLRPGIPSPLAPHLTQSLRGSPSHTPTSASRAGTTRGPRTSGRPPLSVSTAGPPSSRTSLSHSVHGGSRPPSRSQTHTRNSSRSEAISPSSLIPEPSRRASVGSQILSPTDSLMSFGQSVSGRSSRADHSRAVSVDLRPLSRSSMRPPSRSDMRPSSRTEMRPPSHNEFRSSSRTSDIRPHSRIGSVDERGELSEILERSTIRGAGQSTGPRTLGRGPAPGMGGRPMVQTASSTSVTSNISTASGVSGVSAASAQSSVSGASGRNLMSSLTGSVRGPHGSMPAPNTKSLRRAPRRSSVGVHEIGAPPSSIPAPKTPGTRPSSVPMFLNTPPPPVPRIPSNHLRRG